MEQLAIVSFLQNGHPFHLYTYAEIEGVPKGATVQDAAQILPATQIFKYRHHDTYAAFSDLFRYRLLEEKGGYWADTDVVCLRPFDFTSPCMFASVPTGPQWLRWKKRYHIASWFIKVPPGSEIMSYCFTEARKRVPEELAFGEIGPKLLTAAVERFSMQRYVASPGTFGPIYSWQWRQLIDASFTARRKWRALRSAHAVHLYHEMWRRNKVDKNSPFPATSIYEQLKRRYLDGHGSNRT